MLMVNYLGAFLLLGLGLYCMCTRYDSFRIVIGISLTQYAAHLLLVTAGFRAGDAAPIFSLTALGWGSFTVDPLPQSLAVLSILMSLAVTAVGLALCVRMARDHHTLDTRTPGGWKP